LRDDPDFQKLVGRTDSPVRKPRSRNRRGRTIPDSRGI